MGAVLKFESVLETETCINCGMAFSAPQVWLSEKRRNHESFYCPAGHSQYYPAKSKEELLREQLQEKERQLAIERNNRYAAELIANRLKKRINGGMCPCCKRSFTQLGRHMKSKHPDFVKKVQS